MDKKKLKSLRSEIEAALKELGKKHNIDFSVGLNASYGDHFGWYQLEAAEIGPDGFPITKNAERFLNMATMYDLDPEWLFKTFIGNKKIEYRITGLKSSGQVIIERVNDGSEFNAPMDFIRDKMGGK